MCCPSADRRHGQLADQSCDASGYVPQGCGSNGNTCGGFNKNSLYTIVAPTDFGIVIDGSQIMMGINTVSPVYGESLSIVSPNSYNDGAWHQVIASREQSSGEYWLIIDGTEVRFSPPVCPSSANDLHRNDSQVGRVKGPTNVLSGPTTVTIGGARADWGGKSFTGFMYDRLAAALARCLNP